MMGEAHEQHRTLYLIDGYAQFFRAYHAIRTPMTSPVTKEPTNMTFGFVGMLLKLLRGEGKIGGRPDYIAVALDVSGDRGTFRSGLYPAYKANRSEPPEDLAPQVERCLRMLESVGVPCVGSEGFEADDVIAALCDRLGKTHPDLRIRIVSKDKDLKQLLERGRVEMHDVHTDDVFDESRLMEETGLTPAQVVDMLALMGDTVDNVPGVEGVGLKTAAKLIAEFGTLDALLERAGEIKGKRGERLREAAPALGLSRDLVTLRRDASATFSLENASTAQLDLKALVPILKELGFNRYQDEVGVMLGVSTETQSGSNTESALQRQTGGGGGGGGLFEGGLFDSHAQADRKREVEGEYRRVTSLDELDALVRELEQAETFAFDTETTSVSAVRARLCGVSVSTREGEGVYVPVRSPEPGTHLGESAVVDALRGVLTDASKELVGHNLKYDMLVMRNAGVEITSEGAFDTMVASFLIDSTRSSHSMDALSLALLGRENVSIKELIGSGKKQRTFDTVPLDAAMSYAAEDADVTLRLRGVMRPQLRAMGLWELFEAVEMPLVEVLAELEWNGIRVDPEELERQRLRLELRAKDLRDEIVAEAEQACGRGFNPDSPKQLAGVLFNKTDDSEEPGFGIKPVKKLKTGPSTDSEVLEKLSLDPQVETRIPGKVLEYRQLTKLVGTYLVSLAEEINPATGRIHAGFNQTVAATGRLSSSEPNLQNIPIRSEDGREIRKAFVAGARHAGETGVFVLVSADYSQIELRLLAHLSGDPNLIGAFERGEDIHRAVAAQIHGVKPEDVTREMRDGAKMVNFGIVYGITAFGLARRLGIGNTEAGEIIDGYKKKFAGITTFLAECVEQAKRKGYVETMLKRRRAIPDIESNNPSRRSLAERMAINSVVQGSAADLIKVAMIDLHKRIKTSERGKSSTLRDGGEDGELEGVRMLLQIHDELVFECPVGRAEGARTVIVDRMERAMEVVGIELKVPLVVESAVSSDWFGGK